MRVESTNSFTIVEGINCICRSKGTYLQLQVYSRGEYLYVKKGTSYLSLSRNSLTSSPNVKWEELIKVSPADLEYDTDKYGFLRMKKPSI